MREVPGLFSSWISPLPQTPEKGVCSAAFGGVAGVMARNVETWICSTIFCVCVHTRAFPQLGNVSGPEPRRADPAPLHQWGSQCELCPL